AHARARRAALIAIEVSVGTLSARADTFGCTAAEPRIESEAGARGPQKTRLPEEVRPAQRGEEPGRALRLAAYELELAGRSDRPEQAVVLVVRPGREEERVGRPVVRERALAELERPQTVDRQDAAALVAQLAARFEHAVRLP